MVTVTNKTKCLVMFNYMEHTKFQATNVLVRKKYSVQLTYPFEVDLMESPCKHHVSIPFKHVRNFGQFRYEGDEIPLQITSRSYRYLYIRTPSDVIPCFKAPTFIREVQISSFCDTLIDNITGIKIDTIFFTFYQESDMKIAIKMLKNVNVRRVIVDANIRGQ